MIDASIPLKGLLINRADENLKRQQYEMGQLRMGQMQEEQQNRSRLADLLPRATSGDQQAMSEIAAIDPDIWSKLNSQQAAALEANREKIVLGAKIVRQFNPQDQVSWDNARQAAARMGVDVSDVPATFDPNYVQQLTTIADALEKQSGAEQPSSVREYQYAREQGYTGSYVDFKNQFAAPVMFDVNGDGAPDLVPRSMAVGGGSPAPQGPRPIQSKAEYDALPAGSEYIDPTGKRRVKGGQTARPSGPFPSAGN